MSSTTQALRPVLAERRIGVHGVYPAGIDTDMLAGIDLPKTPPAEVARGVLDGLASDLEDIFPDPNSEQCPRCGGRTRRASSAPLPHPDGR
jgi:NAD(P)-dependent dehydrogenase (short-subunit alcohol dehydrogenase family)